MTQLEVLEILPSTYFDPASDPLTPLRLLGSFSSQVCGWGRLRGLAIPYTDITGVLPACIWNMTHLEYLDLSGLDLSTMELPTEVFSTSLTDLDLAWTNIDAAFLDTVGLSAAVDTLCIAGNNIINLADGIANLSHLSYFEASSNLITEVPIWIANLSQLFSLDLSDNNISDVSGTNFNFLVLRFLYLSKNVLRDISMSFQFRDNEGVRHLDFSQNKIERMNLSGSVALEVDVSENFLSDAELHLNLSQLVTLTLAKNRIRRIPNSLFSSANLGKLDLSNNPLQDISGLCQLGSVASLSLSNISIPIWTTVLKLSCIKTLEVLSELDLSSNISGDLAAIVSSCVYDLIQVEVLDLSNNNISGDLGTFSPPSDNLWSLDLSGNQLTGEIPRSLFSLEAEYEGGVFLNLSGNRLVGRLPEPHGQNWTLDLSKNRFEGPLPSFFNCTFGALILSGNNFTGVIPSELRRSSLDFIVLDLSYNRMSGEIPVYLENFVYLEVLDLTSNEFNGSIPKQLGNCWLLQHLRVKNNSLQGQIPSSIGQIGESLLSFTGSYNHIEGPIPSSLGLCVGLKLLDLSHNNLDGTLPLTLENLSSSLRVFTVASNGLSGDFPAWLVSSNLSSLQVLDLSNNSFSGDLPADYSALSGFINGTTSGNNDTLYHDTVNIFVSGRTLEVTYFVTLRTSFDVSSNHFSGAIPGRFGELRALRYLTLSCNAFLGTIPAELSNLQQLDSLDLSDNALSGSIPSELARIPGLAFFNVSDNFLSGEIPQGGQFNTFNPSWFENNSGLCGFPLAPCQAAASPDKLPNEGPNFTHRRSGKQTVSRWISLDAVLVGFGTGFGIAGATFLVSRRARKLLYTPFKKKKVIYDYNEPYGAYVPKT